MTAQKLDFLMDLYPGGDLVKVRIYVNESGFKMAAFDNDLFSSGTVCVDYLGEMIRVMQEVLEAARKGADAQST